MPPARLFISRDGLHAQRFKVRHVCSSIIDEEDPTILNLPFLRAQDSGVFSLIMNENSGTCSRIASDNRARLFISNVVWIAASCNVSRSYIPLVLTDS